MSGPGGDSGEGERESERVEGAADATPSPHDQADAGPRAAAEAAGGGPRAQETPARAVNPMMEPGIDKVVVNIGVGEGGEKLVKAERVLMMITKQKAVRTISRTTNKDLGIRWGMPIGCKVTIRKRAAEEFLKTTLWVKENKLTSYSFDHEGNFSFGISDYTDFPGQKYNPEIGIFGMDISVVMTRAGKRVSQRVRARRAIPRAHRLTAQEVMDFLRKRFNVEVVE